VTNTLTVARTGLAEALVEEGFRVLPEVPQTFSPPLCWISPRDPYRQQAQVFGCKRVSLAVVCLAASGTNAKALEALDEMTSSVADFIEASDQFRLGPSEIEAPGLYTSAQGQEFLGAAVNVLVDVSR
jgi:hypothetical protein